MSEYRKLKKRAKENLFEVKLIIRKSRKKIGEKTYQKGKALEDSVKAALKAKDPELLEKELKKLEDFIEDDVVDFRPNHMWETSKALFAAILVALAIRWVFIESFRIPSESMVPTLLEGDQLLVDKLAYGIDAFVPYINPDLSEEGKVELQKKGAIRWKFKIGDNDIIILAQKIWLRKLPERGDVIIFRHPKLTYENYVKRVVGLPGDTIQMVDGNLFINGKIQDEARLETYTGPVAKDSCSTFGLYEEKLEQNQIFMFIRLFNAKTRADFRAMTIPVK